MSGNSYDSECPVCGNEMNSYSENRPYEIVIHTCNYCGFYTYVSVGRMDVDEVISNRLNDLEDDENIQEDGKEKIIQNIKEEYNKHNDNEYFNNL